MTVEGSHPTDSEGVTQDFLLTEGVTLISLLGKSPTDCEGVTLFLEHGVGLVRNRLILRESPCLAVAGVGLVQKELLPRESP